MFSFSDYKNLSPTVRALASRYWAEVVKTKLGATCPNQILQAHLNEDMTSIPGWSNNSSRFWNRMLAGKPVAQERKVDETEKVLFGTKALLLHPLWQLLGTTEPAENLVNRCLQALPQELCLMFFNTEDSGARIRKQKLTTQQERKLFSQTSLDVMACFLAMSIEARSQRDIRGSQTYEMGLQKVFLRLSVVSELEVVAKELYQAIDHTLYCSAEDTGRVEYIQYVMPIPTQIVPSGHRMLLGWQSLYKEALGLALAAGWITDNHEERVALLYALNHTQIKEFLVELALINNGELTMKAASFQTGLAYNILNRRLAKRT